MGRSREGVREVGEIGEKGGGGRKRGGRRGKKKGREEGEEGEGVKVRKRGGRARRRKCRGDERRRFLYLKIYNYGQIFHHCHDFCKDFNSSVNDI